MLGSQGHVCLSKLSGYHAPLVFYLLLFGLAARLDSCSTTSVSCRAMDANVALGAAVSSLKPQQLSSKAVFPMSLQHQPAQIRGGSWRCSRIRIKGQCAIAACWRHQWPGLDCLRPHLQFQSSCGNLSDLALQDREQTFRIL